MKKIFTISLIVCALAQVGIAQNVAVNADASLPNSSAMLDVKSSSKGMLIPRVALTGINDLVTIPSPANSLMVYNTASAGSGASAVTPGYYFWDGSWTRMVAQKGGAVPFADFYALMPGDNAATVPIGGAIDFPRTDIANSSITSFGTSSFILPDIGTYEITFQVSVNEPTQLGIAIAPFPGGPASLVQSSVVGRATGSTQVVGSSLITTGVPNTSLSIINIGFGSITLPPLAGGNSPVSAHLVIKKLN